MGEAKRRQVSDKAYLAAQSECVFCGAPPDTIDHFPSRSIFRGRAWPEGYRFAACHSCNASTKDDEMVVAVLARASIWKDGPDPEMFKLLDGIKNNRKDIQAEWLSLPQKTITEIRKDLREKHGEELGDRIRENFGGHIHIGPLTKAAASSFFQKFGKALYFLHTGKRLTGRVFYKAINKLQTPQQTVDTLLDILPLAPGVTRNRVDLSDQFFYRFNYSIEQGIFASLIDFPAGQFIYFLSAADEPMATEVGKLVDELDRKFPDNYTNGLKV